jgi:putative hydrolase of the HAD superfamily
MSPGGAPARIEAVFLDLGNVLVFHDDHVLLDRLSRQGGRAADDIRRALDPLWIPAHRGALAGDDLRHAVGRAAGTELSVRAFDEIWTCHFRIHDEVLPHIEALIGRVKVLLLSNTNAPHFEFLRPDLPILDRFDSLVLSYRIGLCKPEPEIFAEALRRAGVPPEAAAYFDDIAAYVEAAGRLGIHGRLFTDAPRFAAQLAELGL